MNSWRTILTFTYPHEAYIVKGRLESEGIEVQIKDELTAQVNNFYSNAIGGVKLLVQEKDFDNASKILIETGQIKESKKRENRLLNQFDKITSKLPFIGNSIIELRLMVLVAILLFVLITPIALISIPTTLERLTQSSWCVDKIYYRGQELIPFSLGIKMTSEYDNCDETMNFRKNGIVDFPGINSYGDRAHWEYKSDSLIITVWSIGNNHSFDENLEIKDGEDQKSIFLGAYLIEIKDNRIRLQSDSLIILGKVHTSSFRF